jgi:hypothetical protein
MNQAMTGTSAFEVTSVESHEALVGAETSDASS